MRQIAVGDFRSGVTLDREQKIRFIHAAAVVDDADQSPAAVLDRDVDFFRARVERVFDELLHGGARPLDHLAGGDAVDQNRVEATDGHDESSARRSAIIGRPRPARGVQNARPSDRGFCG